MAKSKINEKMIHFHKFDVEGTLNIDELQEGQFVMEVEDEGEIDIINKLRKFNGRYVKISIADKEEENIED